jgi:hypothetical protein
MAKHDLSPGFIELGYVSSFARHVATLPTRAWNELGGTRGAGGYLAWDASNRDALDMIEDYAADMALLLPSSVTITDWIIYVKNSPTDPSVPVMAGSLSVAGSHATPGWSEAVQMTFSIVDTGFYPSKLVVLDAASENTFSKVAGGSLDSTHVQLPGGFIADTNAWSSRAGNQPKTIRNMTVTLNEKLRQSYHLR